MDMKQWALHDIEICSICFFQVLTFFIFIFENRVILWVSINYPKPILKELFNLQLWSCTFFQHVTVLFHLYTSFKFLESFAYCVPLSASLNVTSATKLFFVIKQRLMKKKCFVLEISRFLCFCDTCRFQNLWRHKYWYIMQATLMLVSFES